MKFIANLGHQASAYIESVAHAKTRSAAMLRSAAVFALTGTLFTLATIDVASASNNLQSYASDASGKTNVVTDIMSYVCYIGGAGLAALGIDDLTKHVENPSQTPMKNGIAKLGFGGMLLGLPYFTSVIQGTTGGSANTSASLNKFTNKPQI